MPEAPRSRPEKHTVLSSFAANIKARPDAVFAAAAARLREGTGTVGDYLADPDELLIVVQGGWWYRAEYRIVPDDRGVILEHVLVNVAQRGDKAAPLAGRRAITGAPLAFHDLVKRLRAELE